MADQGSKLPQENIKPDIGPDLPGQHANSNQSSNATGDTGRGGRDSTGSRSSTAGGGTSSTGSSSSTAGGAASSTRGASADSGFYRSNDLRDKEESGNDNN